MQRKAFTLIELLVVIAIIAILAAILFPVFAQAKLAAKRSVDISNVKQIALGTTVYMTDNDDICPLQYTYPSGGWRTSRELNYKDFTLPYIKNGGAAYNNGVANQTPGNGGIFESPLYKEAAWSNADPSNWGGLHTSGVGDETTRFPRSYGVNSEAGLNEGNIYLFGFVQNSDTANPTVRPSSSVTSLIAPAGTIMLAPTRWPQPYSYPQQMGNACLANGGVTSSKTLSCVPSAGGNKQLNVAFFDGHAKSVNGLKSISDDLWGDMAYLGSTTQTSVVNNAKAIAEWGS